MRPALVLPLIVLALSLGACGSERSPPVVTAGQDAGAFQAPRLDAGTGQCADDYQLTRSYCGETYEDEERRSCLYAAANLYEPCVGEAEACSRRCSLDPLVLNDGAVPSGEEVAAQHAACRAACPAAPDAG